MKQLLVETTGSKARRVRREYSKCQPVGKTPRENLSGLGWFYLPRRKQKES
jgi:hypothetical protein